MYSTCLYDIIAALQLAAVIIFCRRHAGNRCVPSYLHSIRYHGALSDRYQIELIYLLVVLALGIFSDADLGISPRQTVESLVLSLCSLDTVERVKIVVDREIAAQLNGVNVGEPLTP